MKRASFLAVFFFVATARSPLFSQPVSASASGHVSARVVPIVAAINAPVAQGAGYGATPSLGVSLPTGALPGSLTLRPVISEIAQAVLALPVATIETAKPGVPIVSSEGNEKGRDGEVAGRGSGMVAAPVAERERGLLERAEKTASELLGGRHRSGQDVPEPQKVILLVTVLDKNGAFTHWGNQALKMEYQRAYPGRRVVSVEGKGREQALSLLKTALHEGEMVSHLLIGTHGSFTTFSGESSTFLQEIGRFFVKLTPPYARGVGPSFDDFFAPIRGRLLDGASITLDSCSVFGGRVKDAIHRAEAILDYFGLQNGRISGADTLSLNVVPTWRGAVIEQPWIHLTMAFLAVVLMIVVPVLAPAASFHKVMTLTLACAALIFPGCIVLNRIVGWAMSRGVSGFIIRRVDGHLGKIDRAYIFRRFREYLGIIQK